MLTRTIKKTAYGTLYLALFIGFAYLLARPFIPQPPPPVPTPTLSPYQPVEIEQTVVISHTINPASPVRTVDIVTSLKNPNLRAGISDYPLTFMLYDTAGQLIATASGQTYLLPGARQYAAALNVSFPVQARIARAEVIKPDNPAFIEVPPNVDIPQFNLFLRERQDSTLEGAPAETQRGIVTNAGTFDWLRVEVIAVGLNQDKDIIAVGKTFVGKLSVGEQREFSIEWPKPDEPVTQVIALPAANMFQEDNVIEIIGDPSTLR